MSEQIMEGDSSQNEISSSGTTDGTSNASVIDMSQSTITADQEIIVPTLKPDPKPEPTKVAPKKSKPVDIAANGILVEGSAEMRVQNYSTIKLSNTKIIVFEQRGKKYKFTRA